MKGIYVDSNVFIQGIIRNDENCKNVIRKIAKKEYKGITSVLTWDEIVHIVKKFLGKDISKIEGAKFFTLPNFIFVDAKKDIILKAQKLIEEYEINPRDAIHIATAINSGINEIISEDSDFDIVKEIKRVSPKNFK